MGFEIYIVPKTCYLTKGVEASKHAVETAGLSYNWGDMSEICKKHIDRGKCTKSCVPNPLWYIRDDLDNLTGIEVAGRAFSALMQLAEMDIGPREWPVYGNSWAWGITDDSWGEQKRMPPKHRAEVFAYHLQRILNLGLKYFDHVFICD